MDNSGIISQEHVTGHVLDMGDLTLRDYFAAKAMQALLACPGDEIRKFTPEGILVLPKLKGIPVIAYQYADAMLKARSIAPDA